MASTSETGHSVNIVNFKLIIDRVTGFGSDYDPITEKIKISNMTSQAEDAVNLENAYIVSIEAMHLPVHSREDKFDVMGDLTKRSLNLYKSTNASKRNFKSAKGLADKITGNNIKVKKLADGSLDPKSISKSQKSFTKKAENFKHLIELYRSDANYDTNIADLKITNLDSILTGIDAANSEVAGLITEMDLARIARNRCLYLVVTGMIDVSLACKDYVKSLYGARADKTKTVTGIALRRFLRINY